jgi:hypothetical protein
LRHFDPQRRRAGLPEDVAALISHLDDRKTVVTLVNLNPVSARSLTMQAGAYAEHRIDAVSLSAKRQLVNAPALTLTLGAGCGAQLELEMSRYVNAPTLAFPWDR